MIIKVGNLPNVHILKYNNIRDKTIKVSIMFNKHNRISFMYNDRQYCLYNGEYRILKGNKINKLLYKLNL